MTSKSPTAAIATGLVSPEKRAISPKNSPTFKGKISRSIPS